MQELEMKLEKINFADKFGNLPVGDYAVGLIAKMNDYDFKIVKFKGDFVWHSHPNTDETFIILEGTLIMNFRDYKVEVNAGEMIVIPKGVEHKPHLRTDTRPFLSNQRECLIGVTLRVKSQ
jgi:hypothetical protein